MTVASHTVLSRVLRGEVRVTSPKTVCVGGYHGGSFYVNDIFSVETVVKKHFEVCYFLYRLFCSDDRQGIRSWSIKMASQLRRIFMKFLNQKYHFLFDRSVAK